MDALLLARHPGLDVFIAKRDIGKGETPLEVMFKDNLLVATLVIPLCSKKSRSSPWLYWETASVWARGHRVIPLFVDVSPNEFQPIGALHQGAQLFDPDDLNAAIRAFAKVLSPRGDAEPLKEKERCRLMELT